MFSLVRPVTLNISGNQVNTVKSNDPMTHTYQFDCNESKGDTIWITDNDVGNVGHGISEVKIFGRAFFGMLK